MTIPEPVRSEILARIRSAEDEHDVRTLLAVESGSRAWDFESPNSDFDARFIYAHRHDWYLSVGLEEKRDVIEYEIVDDIDLNGWDVRKALRLFRRSNPSIVEWLQSPIVYSETGPFASRARGLLPDVYSCDTGTHHYLSMAKTNYRGYLKADLVPLKKYFYVLRPLLSVRWLERYRTAAPIEFGKLLHLIEDRQTLLADINGLLERKRGAPELGSAPSVDSIDDFIQLELERLDGFDNATDVGADSLPQLDVLFHECLRVAWA